VWVNGEREGNVRRDYVMGCPDGPSAIGALAAAEPLSADPPNAGAHFAIALRMRNRVACTGRADVLEHLIVDLAEQIDVRCRWPRTRPCIGRARSYRAKCEFRSRRELLQQRLCLLQIERVEAFGEPPVDWGEKTRQQCNDRKKGRPKAYGPRSKMTLRLLAGIGTVSLREKA
jgi:hypothetical protein